MALLGCERLQLLLLFGIGVAKLERCGRCAFPDGLIVESVNHLQADFWSAESRNFESARFISADCSELPSESHSTADSVPIFQDLRRCWLVLWMSLFRECLLKERLKSLRGGRGQNELGVILAFTHCLNHHPRKIRNVEIGVVPITQSFETLIVGFLKVSSMLAMEGNPSREEQNLCKFRFISKEIECTDAILSIVIIMVHDESITARKVSIASA